MTISWLPIAEHLRNELQGYGGLLALFEEQQAHLLRRNPDAVLELAGTIEAQARSTAEQRLKREMAVRELAEVRGYPADTPLRELLPLFPAEVQPMLDALVDEINHLIHRVRRGARQNQLLLGRAVEMRQQMLSTLRPAAFVKTYSQRGAISVSTGDAAWQAAG